MSNTGKKNVPELRFPEFEGEWEEKKLGDLGLFQKSYSFSRAKEGNGKTKHIHYGDIHSKFKTVLDSDGNIPNIIEKAVFELIQKGDIVFADASEDYSDLGKAVMIDFEPNSLISGLHTHLFRPLNNAISNFLIFYTKTLSYKKFIRQQGTGISVLGISKKSLLNLNVLIPRSELEQQKIGQFFIKLDRQIELEEQKLELLQQQKKGYMQKIFSQELRFKDENGNDYPEWEEKQLGEFACKATKKNIDKKYTETLTNSAELGIISQRDFFDKEISNIDNIKNYYVVEENDFVYNPRISTYAPFGPVNRNKLEKKGVMSPLYTVFRIQSIDLNFIEFYFKSSKWYRFMALNGDSGARADRFSIKDKTFMEMPLYIPCMDEQIKIGQFFDNIDKCIKNYQSKISLLKKNKKSFLQKMFI
ncbi:TPA: restriction endonuclease subunit S [Staphylococcus aureus]|nr:restriction endonuclease subunit S [Staphylococcus aureus]HCY1194731.1 restriction endonuclease subunit S [Staphylococcus aureus]HDA2142361.1 restriction endonuclease subunit S [Staphylococcus aureus]HDY4569660.1 restriction endonuclease subunit S [Staphylococcus aureus]HDY4636807.1 restriction endonuclease subunit S [Staphylococcus aureus]